MSEVVRTRFVTATDIARVVLGWGTFLGLLIVGPMLKPPAPAAVLAVAMIIMNLVIGLCLLLGGLRHGEMKHNRTGTSAYLSMLIVLAAFTCAARPDREGGRARLARKSRSSCSRP